ncbi:hypothetical protein [Candidatus Palauibacter sp.]|uniref:hypothetical protein n=1 Tax=Candidatus Palauibacter sp. TaxID=3101350 RepID=UPI003C6FF9F8
MNLPTLTELSTKELLAMRDRTEKRIEADSAYVMRRLQETDDPDWYEKIERAKQAREIGEKLQKSARKHKNIHGNARKHDFREKNSPVRGVPFQPLQARR